MCWGSWIKGLWRIQNGRFEDGPEGNKKSRKSAEINIANVEEALGNGL
jgi:hypothetical protein